MRFKLGILGFGLLSIVHSILASPTQDTVRIIVKYKEPISNITSLKSRIMQMTQLPVSALDPMANGALDRKSTRLNSSH